MDSTEGMVKVSTDMRCSLNKHHRKEGEGIRTYLPRKTRENVEA
jgi:hypothetical protein